MMYKLLTFGAIAAYTAYRLNNEYEKIDNDPHFESEQERNAAKAMAGIDFAGNAIRRPVFGNSTDAYLAAQAVFDGQQSKLQYLQDNYLNKYDGGGSTGGNGAEGGADGHDGDNDGREDNPPWDDRPQDPQKPNTEGDQGSPLVLDLDGDGVELYQVGSYGTFFDLRGNGQAVLTGWVEPDDGLLAIDLNGDGIINDVSELFGSTVTDGFAVLKSYDSNSDGVIDSNDTEFSNLLVWTDVNSDGFSQTEELHTLLELNIASISLDVTLVNIENEGNYITHESSYTLLNGTERQIVDAWFNYDASTTESVESFYLDFRAVTLPQLKGGGDLKDFIIAMSNDSELSGNLLDLVDDFASTWGTVDAIANWSTVLSDVDAILYRWAGIENVDPNSRGDFVDAQHLAFNEAFRGEPFSQFGQSDPLVEAGQFSEAVYQYLRNFFGYQLISQVTDNEIFEDVIYNYYTGGIDGDLTLKQSGIDAIEAAAIASTNPSDVWVQFANFLGYTKGFDNLTTSEISALDTAVDDSNISGLNDWQDVVNLMTSSLGSIIEDPSDWGSFEVYYDYHMDGTSSGETLTDNDSLGPTASHELDGKDGDDTIYGLNGHDKLIGGNGNDTLIGGVGDDYLLGGSGNDTYVYDSGNDTFSESGGSGTDKIVISAASGLDETDLVDMYRYGDSLVLLMSNGNVLNIHNYASAGQQIEAIEFESTSTVIDLTALTMQKYQGTSGADHLDVSGQSFQILAVYGEGGNDIITAVGGTANFYGGDGYDVLIGDYLNDTLRGEGQDDYLIGNGGNDHLYGGEGNDTLDGGAGNDTLTGGDGANTFIFGVGYGQDFVENNPTITDSKILFDSTVSTSDIILYRGNTVATRDDMTFQLSGTSDQITVEDMYAKNGSWTDLIKGVQFADGTFWDDVYIREKYISDHTTSGNDTVIGFEAHDVFYASAGDDIIRGFSGNDTYYWNGSSGNDIIYDETKNSNNGQNGDKVIFEAANLSNLTFAASGDNLVVTHNSTSTTLTIDNQFVSGTSSYKAIFRIDSFEFADGTILTYNQIEDLVFNGHTFGTALDDIITGTSFADNIHGLSGNDLIEGLGGNDILEGGAGNDRFIFASGFGADTISDFTQGQDKIDLYSIASIVDFADLTRTQVGSNTVITYSGSSDQITLTGITATNLVESDFIFGPQYGTSGNDWLYGTSGDDTIFGQGGEDRIYGYGGNDRLDGGTEADIVEGGDGDDFVFGNAGDDVISGQAGNDQLYGGDGADYVWGNEGNDILYGEGGVDALRGMEGDDILYGGDGNDNLRGDDVDSDPSFVGAGNDVLYGEAGNDNLAGGAGDDILRGGLGQDSLYGNTGSDTFLYITGDIDTNRDYIYDFTSGIGGDIIDISDVLQYNSLTDTLSDFVFLVQGGSYTRINIDIDGSGTAYGTQAVAQIQNVTGLNLTDMVNNGNLIVETA